MDLHDVKISGCQKYCEASAVQDMVSRNPCQHGFKAQAIGLDLGNEGPGQSFEMLGGKQERVMLCIPKNPATHLVWKLDMNKKFCC